MRWILALVLIVLVAAAALGGWRIQQLSERLDAVQAERNEVADALDDLKQRAELLSASDSELQTETEEMAATIADLQDVADSATRGGGADNDGVFDTFRGPVSIEDLYFELVDDEFEGVPNSRIDRMERCLGGRPEPDDVCGPLPPFGD